MNVKLFGLGTYSYLCLKFNSNCLWTHDNCCPNSLRPSFPTHSLQIYCLGLIGPTYPILRFGPQIETLQMLWKLELWYKAFYLLPKEHWFTSFKSFRDIILSHGKFDETIFCYFFLLLLAWNGCSLKTKYAKHHI